MSECRECGLSGKLTAEIQSQLDLFEQMDHDVEKMVIALLGAVVP